MNKNFRLFYCLLFAFVILHSCDSENKVIWQIGQADNNVTEFALSPDGYKHFVENDFGWEDRFFLVGNSQDSTDFPYILPGPSDEWGGTSGTAGWRSHSLNILFGVEKIPTQGQWKLVVDFFDINTSDITVFKITINGKSLKYELPFRNEKSLIDDTLSTGHEFVVEIPLESNQFKAGGNEVNLTVLQGSWIKFDQIRLEGSAKLKLSESRNVFLRDVKAADYEIETPAGKAQPLLVDVEHLDGEPTLDVFLDGEKILSVNIETGRYIFEAPMPAVEKETESNYEIRINGEKTEKGKIRRTPGKLITPAGYASTMLGTAHSRWMLAPGPWMPFSMVKMSPENQNADWQGGYDPIFESVSGFSHLHEWTLGGLLMMPANGTLQTTPGDEKRPDEGYRSRIDKTTEEAGIGYYKVDLTDYEIKAELTATTRCSFQRHTFPKNRGGSRVLIDLQFPAEYTFQVQEAFIEKVNETRISGFSKQLSPNTWSGGISQSYTVYFVIEFDQPIANFGVWSENGIINPADKLHLFNCADAGAFAEFNTTSNQVVQVRTGISYVSAENAALNLETEIVRPFDWDFSAVRENQFDTWNHLFDRVKITSNDQREKMRFYSNMYRALCSRNTYSDVDGKWVDADEKVRQLADPESPALGCDAFWNTFWNLNQFWNLVTPEWSSRWVKSQLSMYDANGWLAKGPAGMEYIPVMVAEHEIPLIVGAWQMGIRDFDGKKAFEAVKKMQTTPARKVGGGFAGNEDLQTYLKHQFVPYNEGRFSNSLEYSFDDWTVGQFAKSLGNENDFLEFNKRGTYWKNAIDPETGFARMKDSKGEWLADFDPFKSGANHHYVEGNAWQLTFFVPQDVPALAELIGEAQFVERLNWGFEESNKLRFNAPNDRYWDYPVIQGNQQSMHFAFLFNWVEKPWLTQKWSRAIMERYYGYGLSNAWLGDEDQGQMSAWFIMASLGLFQTDGGCRVEPVYEIASPLYQKVEIYLGNQYGRGDKFIIEARNASRKNKYVQSAVLNGKPLETFQFPANELLKGGSLVLEMGPEPNYKWGVHNE
jgi:predicted alpha-1,2-mannosidase